MIGSGNATKAPWGTHAVICSGPGWQAKVLSVNAGEAISLQRHKHRSEVWVCVGGSGIAIVGEIHRQSKMKPGEVVSIGKGQVHRLSAAKDEVLQVVEVQLGTTLAESDIERLEDKYGRA